MDTIVAISRGNGRTALRKEKKQLMVFRGGKIRDMAQAAVNTLSSLPPSQSTNTVYFFNLPDTTLKLKKNSIWTAAKYFMKKSSSIAPQKMSTQISSKSSKQRKSP